MFAGIGAYGLGVGPFSSGKFGAGFLKGPLAKKLFLSDPTKGFALANINPYTAILGTSLAAGLLSKEDEEDEKLPTQAQSDPEFQKYLAFYGGPRRYIRYVFTNERKTINTTRNELPRVFTRSSA